MLLVLNLKSSSRPDSIAVLKKKHLRHSQLSIWIFSFDLGILASPKRLAISNFTAMLAKIENSISFLRHFRISMAGKTILINSSIMPIPLYYLFVYPIPDSILDAITKAARSFFWSKGGNRKGMNSDS